MQRPSFVLIIVLDTTIFFQPLDPKYQVGR